MPARARPRGPPSPIEVPMKKARMNHKLRPLVLEKETLVHHVPLAQLDAGALDQVVGGNRTTVPSQCVTLCF
jgi:hypothetical protein